MQHLFFRGMLERYNFLHLCDTIVSSHVPYQSARVISLVTCGAAENTKRMMVFKGINIEEQPILDMLDFGEQDHAK